MTIFDQLETESVYSYSGSYGSYAFWPRTSIFFTGSFSREVVGDYSTNYFDTGSVPRNVRKYFVNDFPYSVFQFTNQGLWLRKRFARFNIGITENEQYFDTVVGHPISYVKENGISFILNPNLFQYNDADVYAFMDGPAFEKSSSVYLYVGSSSCQITRNDTSEQYCDSTWNYAAPFQSKYKNVPRQKSPTFIIPFGGTTNVTHSIFIKSGTHKLPTTASFTSVNACVFVTQSSNPNEVPRHQIIFPDNARLGDGTSTIGIETIALSTSENVVGTKYGLYKNFFGFGDGPDKFPGTTHTNQTVGGVVYSYGIPVIRGWKYGMISAFPTYTKAVFRYGRFGQPRDLLEQRPYTKFYNSENVLDSPVQVKFLSGTQDYINARDYVTATNPSYDPRDSGFWDYQYRSGFPFVDIDNID